MGRAIIIIHNSELLRKGLATALENKFAVRILCFSQAEELNQSGLWGVDEVVFIVGSTFTNIKSLFQTSVKSRLLIGLYLIPDKKGENLFDGIFSIYDPLEVLIKQIEQFFTAGEKNENDELTTREKEVLRLIALGHTNKTIADKLFISTHTVISHRKNITEKLGIKSIPGLTVYAIIQNIVSTSEITPDQLL